MSARQPVVVERPRDGVALITLNRPGVRNALNLELLQALEAALNACEQDADVACAVLTGAGPAFSAGADLKAVEAMGTTEFRGLTEAFKAVSQAARRSAKPLIAAVNGYAVAGGFEVACLCDFRLVAHEALVWVGDVEVDMTPTSGLTWLLPEIVGLGWAQYLAVVSPRVAGRRAVEIGLAQEAVPLERLLPRALDVAERIARLPPLSVGLTKDALYHATKMDLDVAATRELELADRAFREGEGKAMMAAFLTGGRASADRPRNGGGSE